MDLKWNLKVVLWSPHFIYWKECLLYFSKICYMDNLKIIALSLLQGCPCISLKDTYKSRVKYKNNTFFRCNLNIWLIIIQENYIIIIQELTWIQRLLRSACNWFSARSITKWKWCFFTDLHFGLFIREAMRPPAFGRSNLVIMDPNQIKDCIST